MNWIKHFKLWCQLFSCLATLPLFLFLSFFKPTLPFGFSAAFCLNDVDSLSVSVFTRREKIFALPHLTREDNTEVDFQELGGTVGGGGVDWIDLCG